MPFSSKAQQRYLESKASPLTAGQRKEWESATDFSHLPERAKDSKPARRMHGDGKKHWSGK